MTPDNFDFDDLLSCDDAIAVCDHGIAFDEDCDDCAIERPSRVEQ